MSISTIELQGELGKFTDVVSKIKQSCNAVRTCITSIDTGVINKELVDEIISGIDTESKVVKSDRLHSKSIIDVKI